MSSPLFVSERSKPGLTTRPLSVGCLICERMDQIDFTGPFEALSRMPDTTVQIIGKELSPIRDVQGRIASLFLAVPIGSCGQRVPGLCQGVSAALSGSWPVHRWVNVNSDIQSSLVANCSVDAGRLLLR
jgi:hypothetical protein